MSKERKRISRYQIIKNASEFDKNLTDAITATASVVNTLSSTPVELPNPKTSQGELVQWADELERYGEEFTKSAIASAEIALEPDPKKRLKKLRNLIAIVNGDTTSLYTGFWSKLRKKQNVHDGLSTAVVLNKDSRFKEKYLPALQELVEFITFVHEIIETSSGSIKLTQGKLEAIKNTEFDEANIALEKDNIVKAVEPRLTASDKKTASRIANLSRSTSDLQSGLDETTQRHKLIKELTDAMQIRGLKSENARIAHAYYFTTSISHLSLLEQYEELINLRASGYEAVALLFAAHQADLRRAMIESSIEHTEEYQKIQTALALNAARIIEQGNEAQKRLLKNTGSL